jgi:hypothetical protein
MDELKRVAGGLLTEETVGDGVMAVETYTCPETIRGARRLLAQITPFPVWVRHQHRSVEARTMYLRILRELGATIAGHQPDELTIICRRQTPGVETPSPEHDA